jgi:putative addiction module component (TIGR02574 family)
MQQFRGRANLMLLVEVIMGVTAKALGIDRLGVDERLALVEEIWASICVDAKAFPLTEMQRAELDRRTADDEAFPDDVVAWDEIKAAARSRLGR